MSRTLTEKLLGDKKQVKQSAVQRLERANVAQEDESDVDFDLDDEPRDGQTEQELERLVFGDTNGILEGIKAFGLNQSAEEHEARQDLAAINDAELFFVDIDPDDNAPALSVSQDLNDSYTIARTRAWEDSDDERMTVSLASAPRLRKLRRTAEEDVVDGREYSLRLRQQFELLNPVPDWAVEAREQPARKRRRLSAEDSDMDMVDENNAREGSDEPSAPPLSTLLRNASSMIRTEATVRGKQRKIKPGVIQIQRLSDVGSTQPSSITSLIFHPAGPMLLSSGPSSTLYLHHITRSPPAAAPNPLLVSLHVKGAPLTTTAIHPTDSRIFMSARKGYFHIWNLETGQVEKITQVMGQENEQRDMAYFKLSPDGQYMALKGTSKKGGGNINIISTKTLQWQMQVRIDSRHGLADFCWWRNGQGLTIAGKNGEINEWSVVEQRIVARWQDEGAVGTNVLALGGQHDISKSSIGPDRWVAIGSTSGIVNIYDRRAWLIHQKSDPEEATIPTQPKPHKVLDHLTTKISSLAFTHDGQLLAMASKEKRDALRLVHLPSATVFKNWPTSSTPLGRISAVAFADGEVIGGDIYALLAVANEQGKIRTWDIL